jgi:hypothetical protein
VDTRVPSIHDSGARTRALQPVVLWVAYTRVSLLGNGTVALASVQVPRRLPMHALGVSCVHRVSVCAGPPAQRSPRCQPPIDQLQHVAGQRWGDCSVLLTIYVRGSESEAHAAACIATYR